jgi:lambda repressor-like predicted transcriptional regulator
MANCSLSEIFFTNDKIFLARLIKNGNSSPVARNGRLQSNHNHPPMSTKNANIGPALLRAKGWTLRPAAKELGVNFTHLHRVLRGERHSASLLRRVAALHPRKSA